MRPSSFEIQDFQSLEDVKLTLGSRSSGGGLTTVVGPSSTGKSAVVRALRLLFENSSFPAVRAGATRAVVSVEDVDGSIIEISRGPSHSVYRTTSSAGIEDKFPKAGRSVPDEIAQRFNLAEGVHFASQFDPPYLLAESGSRVSQVIGAFTHAEEMQAAAREGNRRRLAASAEKQIRVQDMKETAQRIKELNPAGLADERAHLDTVKARMLQAETVAESLATVTRSVKALETIATAEANFQDALVSLSSLPDASDLARAESLRLQLREVAALEKADAAYQEAAQRLAQVEKACGLAEDALRAVEAEIKICPTCGRVMNGLEVPC